jgi:hypothetical protein
LAELLLDAGAFSINRIRAIGHRRHIGRRRSLSLGCRLPGGLRPGPRRLGPPAELRQFRFGPGRDHCEAIDQRPAIANHSVVSRGEHRRIAGRLITSPIVVRPFHLGIRPPLSSTAAIFAQFDPRAEYSQRDRVEGVASFVYALSQARLHRQTGESGTAAIACELGGFVSALARHLPVMPR